MSGPSHLTPQPTPRQRHFIDTARDVHQQLLDGDGDALQLVPRIRDLLASAEAGVDVLDPLGNRQAHDIEAELNAALAEAQDRQERQWQDYERDREQAIGPREATLRARRSRLEAIREARHADDPRQGAAGLDRIDGHLDRVEQALYELRVSHGSPDRQPARSR